MANYAQINFRAEKDLKYTLQLEKLIESYDCTADHETEKLEIFFTCMDREAEKLILILIEVTKDYPAEEFTLELSHEYNNYTSKEIYKVKNGESEFNKNKLSYFEDGNSLDIKGMPEPSHLLDKAFECFKKLDVDSNGKLSHSPHLHTVEIEGENFKLAVSKQGAIFKVEKIFSKVPTYTWEPFEPLPF